MRVLVAMSGGVDSSTVAGLLHEAGHEVIGVTLQLYDQAAGTGRKGACCAGQDIHDARQVADHLGIPHYVIDAEKRFADAVIGDFAASYAAGETPVPCVRCNQTVKFADLTALARGLGCERLATGHYVRRIDGADGPQLHRATDPARDQSWFLFATTREQLAMTLFPLGGMRDKVTVRAEAERLGLPVATKPDSQDICFVASGHYADTVARLRPDAAEPGDIVDRDGRLLGRHGGIAGYTVGQGKRLGAASVHGGRRQTVIALDSARRRVIVAPRGTGTREFGLREVNWLVPAPTTPLACDVKLRARELPQPATIAVRHCHASGEPGQQQSHRVSACAALTKVCVDVWLDAPALPAPGQACVFYDGTRVLGGGFICRTEAAAMVDAAGEAGLSPLPFGADGGVAQR
jgi:tRNA-specific 2-thiouridylase